MSPLCSRIRTPRGYLRPLIAVGQLIGSVDCALPVTTQSYALWGCPDMAYFAVGPADVPQAGICENYAVEPRRSRQTGPRNPEWVLSLPGPHPVRECRGCLRPLSRALSASANFFCIVRACSRNMCSHFSGSAMWLASVSRLLKEVARDLYLRAWAFAPSHAGMVAED